MSTECVYGSFGQVSLCQRATSSKSSGLKKPFFDELFFRPAIAKIIRDVRLHNRTFCRLSLTHLVSSIDLSMSVERIEFVKQLLLFFRLVERLQKLLLPLFVCSYNYAPINLLTATRTEVPAVICDSERVRAFRAFIQNFVPAVPIEYAFGLSFMMLSPFT